MREVWRHTDADGDSIRLIVEPDQGEPERKFAFFVPGGVAYADRPALRRLRDAIDAELGVRDAVR